MDNTVSSGRSFVASSALSLDCDSTRYISLTILEHSESYTEMSICQDEAQWGHHTTGLHQDLLVNAAGCDSIRYLELLVMDHSESYEEVHLCPGENFEGYEAGYYEEAYTNAVGCDSTRYIDVTMIAPTDAICALDYDDKPRFMQETDFMHIAPNPVVDYMNLVITKPERLPSELRIYSSDHRLVYQQNVEYSETSLDFSDMESGVYIIHIQNGNNIFIDKILKL